MPIDYDPGALKQAVEVLVNGGLLSKAEALEVNLSAVLEIALAETVARHQEGEQAWKRAKTQCKTYP